MDMVLIVQRRVSNRITRAILQEIYEYGGAH